MNDVLERIVAATRRRLAETPREPDLRPRAEEAATTREPHRFGAALTRAGRGPRLIAEIKAASPSAGAIAPDPDVESIARAYRRGGAAAISVVAEPEFFHGSMEWIGRAAEASGLPVLMKHFVVDERQIFEGVASGADGILLLASLLDTNELKRMIAIAENLGRDALVEVHDDEELDRALEAGARILGVNNRNLRDFTVDLGTAERLSPRIEGVRVAESGMRSADDAARMGRAGFDAILVGEHLLRQDDREAAARALAGPPAVKICGITRVEDALAAAEAGASFLGLVFAEGSPRRVDVARAKEIADAVRTNVSLVGVFRGQNAETIDAIAREVGLDLAQVYGDARPSASVIRAICVDGAATGDGAAGDAWVLYDGAAPGAGKVFDWSLLAGVRPRRPFVLAGGLRPETVRDAIVRVRPNAVDVSSGVEDAPGIKNAEKIREFVREVHRA
ncbi:MAG: bifunctional indole-3-glycerol phosphate synthase/phosphoribosylanthranilate isomerase [Thermoanaerobaculia bacterium]